HSSPPRGSSDRARVDPRKRLRRSRQSAWLGMKLATCCPLKTSCRSSHPGFRLRFLKGNYTGVALKERLAEDGFDPSTSGLWGQHASAAPLCFISPQMGLEPTITGCSASSAVRACLAEDGFDPSPSGLWAQHVAAAPFCSSSLQSCCWLQGSHFRNISWKIIRARLSAVCCLFNCKLDLTQKNG